MKNKNITQEPLLSYQEINHSLLFLSFFSYYAMPLYGFTSQDFIKNFLPPLLYSQSLVYKADFEIETAQKEQASFDDIKPWLARKDMLMQGLKILNLYSPELENDADNISTYWQIENKMMYKSEITSEMIDQAIKLRINDIMLLHHICKGVAQVSFAKEVWETIRIFEIIRDIESDLREYQDDVVSGDFNIYIMAIKLYGAEAKSYIQAELEKYKNTYQDHINNLSNEYSSKFKKLTDLHYKGRPVIPIPEPIS